MEALRENEINQKEKTNATKAEESREWLVWFVKVDPDSGSRRGSLSDSCPSRRARRGVFILSLDSFFNQFSNFRLSAPSIPSSDFFQSFFVALYNSTKNRPPTFRNDLTFI